MSRRLFSLLLLLCLAFASYPARAGEAGEGGIEEAPVVVGLLAAGMRAEALGVPHAAETRYCAASRLGSSEAQYRLGKLYLGTRSLAVPAPVAFSLLGFAARTGHRPAQALLARQGAVPGEAVVPCLQTDMDVLALGSDDALVGLSATDFVARLSPNRRQIAQLVQKLAPAFGVDPRLALAIAQVESNFNPEAISPRNAMGVMQLIPATAARFSVRDPMDPEQNMRGGLAYLRWLLAAFDGDVIRVAAAYNAGEGAVLRHGGVPPFPETREYVRRVVALYGADRHPQSRAGWVAVSTPSRS